MPSRLEKTPRGKAWDNLNRNGRVKELSFTLSHTPQHMQELISNNFTQLALADYSR